MKYLLLIFLLISIVISCKKNIDSNLKEATISHVTDSDCGYLLWVDSGMYKISNESLVYDICKDHLYTKVKVDYELLDSFSSITCPMYTTNTQAQLLKIISVKEE